MAEDRQVLSDEVRRTWRETLNDVEHQGVHVTVMRYSTPTAVIVPVGWYEAANAALHGPQEPVHGPGAS
jgi:hypothetical protein